MKKDPQLQRIEELETQIETLQERLETSENAKIRALADLQNFQRRESENKKNWVNFGIAEFLKQTLPRFLELKLGAQHCNDQDMKKTIEQFFSGLEKNGIQSIIPHKGDPINPDLHEVLVAEEGTPGTVVQTLEPGWKFEDIILAPAKVSAAQN